MILKIFHIIVCVMLVTFSSLVQAQTPPQSNPQSQIAADIATLLTRDVIAELPIEDKASFVEFYAARNYEPVWQNDRSQEAVISAFEDAWQHGLNKNKYLTRTLFELLQSEHEADKAPLDVMISAAIVRYGRDMTGMRVAPNEIGQSSASWRRPSSANAILSFVSAERDTGEALEAFAPQSKLYKLLQKELVSRIDELDEPDPMEHVLPIRINGTLRPGDRHGVVHNIRYRLGMKADPYNDSYDDALIRGIMTFQHENGLRPDGLIGEQTLRALNRSRMDKIDQIIANLERLRWLNPEKPNKYIVVNIPAQTLWAVEDGQIVEEMPVVVGRRGRETEAFEAKVTGVRFNPTWTVPKTIRNEDYIPKLIENPYYLDDKNVKFYAGWGADALELPSDSLDWAAMTESERRSIRIVQEAGANNPLGSIRVLMPNRYDIFLHDTNSSDLFGRSARALSSGCVRMSRPQAIANFILKDNPNWSPTYVQELLEAGKMRDIVAANKFPVFLIYQSIWLDDRGDLIFSPDIYDWDAQLVNALKTHKEIALPQVL